MLSLLLIRVNLLDLGQVNTINFSFPYSLEDSEEPHSPEAGVTNP